MAVQEWVQNIFMFAIVNSCVVAGILKAARQCLRKKGQPIEEVRIYPAVSILVTIAGAFAFTFYFQYAFPLTQILINAVMVGAVSILMYESVLQSVIDIIPTLFKKFLGTN